MQTSTKAQQLHPYKFNDKKSVSDCNLDHHKNITVCSLCHYRHILKTSSKFVHNFLSYFADIDKDYGKNRPYLAHGSNYRNTRFVVYFIWDISTQNLATRDLQSDIGDWLSIT